jgi:hypothetical protein
MQGLTTDILTKDIPSSLLSNLSPELSSLICDLLTRDVIQRLGSKELGGFQKVKSHPVFRHLDWAMVAEKKTQPVFIPDVIFD